LICTANTDCSWPDSLALQASGNLYPGGGNHAGCNFASGNTIGLEIDFDNRKVSFYKNGVWTKDFTCAFLEHKEVCAVISLYTNDSIVLNNVTKLLKDEREKKKQKVETVVTPSQSVSPFSFGFNAFG